MEKDFKEKVDLLNEEVYELSDSDCEQEMESQKIHYERDLLEKHESKRDDFDDHVQVNNKPIEEDISEEDDLTISYSKIKEFDIRVKRERFQVNSNQADDYIHAEDKSKEECPRKGLSRSNKCSYCQKVLASKESLEGHIRTHTGERPYKCSLCQTAFSLKQALQRHIRTHTGERPFKCSDCPKSFTTGEDLKRHIRTHTGERPFQCSECMKSFPRKRSLRMHMETFSHMQSPEVHTRTQTGKQPYKCSHCQMSFSLKKTLNQHIQIHKRKTTQQKIQLPEDLKRYNLRKTDRKTVPTE